MAPKAPIGAARTMMRIMPKKILAMASMTPFAQISQARDGKAGEDRDQQDLQQVAVGEGAEEGVGDDRQQVSDDALLLGAMDVAFDRAGIERGRMDVEAFARLQQF